MAAVLAAAWLTGAGCDGAGDGSALLSRARALHAGLRATEGRLVESSDLACSSRPTDGPRAVPYCLGSLEADSPDFTRAAELARELRQAPEGHVRVLQAGALLHLLWSGTDSVSAGRAVDALERAAADSALDARGWSDLAAARLAAAERRATGRHRLGALDAAERARVLAPASLAARFNLGLAYEALRLDAAADRAWAGYLELDSRSPWADEVRERRHALTGRPDDVDGSLQDHRETTITRTLPTWGQRWLEEDSDGAQRMLRRAHQAVEALEAGGGDRAAADAVRAVEQARGAARERLARGLVAYGRADRLYASQLFAQAGEAARDARRLLAGTPLEVWAEYRLLTLAVRDSRFDAARLGLGALEDRLDPGRYGAVVGLVQWGLGVIEVRQGRLEDAVEHYRRAAEGFRAVNERENLGAMHYLLAEAEELAGRTAEAERHLLLSLDALAGTPNSQWRRSALMTAGDLAEARGLPLAALTLQSEAVGVSRAMDLPQLLAESLVVRARACLAAGRASAALNDVDEAEDHLADMTDPRGRARISADVSAARALILQAVSPGAAADSLSRSIAFYRGAGLAINEVPLRTQRIDALLAAGRTDEASEEMEATIRLLEDQGKSIDDPATRVALLDAARDLFDVKIRFELDRGRPEAALEALERQRVAAAAVSFSETAGRASPSAPGGVQAIRADLPDSAAVLEYAVLPHELVIWAVRRDTLATVRVGVPAHEVARLAERFVTLLRRGVSPDQVRSAGRDLHARVVAPVAPALVGVTELLVIPDAALYGVPFAALPTGPDGGVMVEDMTLRVAASSRFGAGGTAPRAPGPDAHVLLVAGGDHGVPDLPDLAAAEREAERVAGLYGNATVLSSDRASVEALREGLDDYDVFHFAGHAISNATRPDRSYLVLPAREGTPASLAAGDLYGLHLDRLRLVVLSACSTLLPRSARSGGINGIALALNAAGVPGVVGSLWDVEDAATGVLMESFHRHLVEGAHPGSALRAAQLDLLRSGDPNLAHPAQWGPFQLVGH